MSAAPALGKTVEETQSLHAPAELNDEREPAEALGQAVRNLFELLARPDPKYEPFVHFSDKTRLVFVLTQPGGLADTRVNDGRSAQRSLAAIFGPESGASYSFGLPEVEIDGAFGRVRVAIIIDENSRSPECGFAYVDAVLARPGDWARYSRQGFWQFTQITLSFEKVSLKKCPR